jgi:hypothetical protein
MNGDNLVPIRDEANDRATASRPGAANGATGNPPWKQWFDAWDANATQTFEQVLRNPSMLEMGGACLTGMMRMWSATQRARDAWWSAWGLPTRREQERLLHELQRLQSRVIDLQEELQTRDDEARHER